MSRRLKKIRPRSKGRGPGPWPRSLRAVSDNIPPALGRDFDLALLLDVLEHIADDRGSLAGIAGLTHPAGKILITVPACQWLWSGHDERHHHKRRYSKKDLTAVLHDSGLIVSPITCFRAC